MQPILRLIADPRFVLAAAFVGFQVWRLFAPQQPMFERPAHLMFALMLVMLWNPLKGGLFARIADLATIGGVIAVSGYYIWAYERLTTRMENVSPVLDADIIFGLLLVVLLMEGVRRTTGWILLGVIATFLAYAFVGPWMPGWLAFRGFELSDAVEIMSMTTAGVLGITTSTSVEFVFYFIAFGVIYAGVGGGKLFIDLSLRIAGRTVGGAPKAAILASSLMGTISGSAVANVTATGVLTIPLMRRCGLSRDRAAAIEAIASTGGQLLPPIMGVAAFVMAELLAVPYARIALAGLIPAVAFYLALLLITDFAARRTGQGTVSADDLTDVDPIMPRIHLLAPPLVLIGCLVAGYSAPYSAMVATISCFAAAFLRRSTFCDLTGTLTMIRDAGRQAAEVAVPIAAIGIIIVVAIQSNLALKFSGSLIAAAGGAIVPSLAIIVVGCIIMGMGLPTVAAYIIGAVFYVPALRDLGVSPLSAHFFIFYYCVLSMVTPPVALASFAAAGVAGGSAMRTSVEAFGLSLVAFFIPFAFIFDEALLFNGTPGHIALAFGGMLAATSLWAGTLAGYIFRPLSPVERAGLAVAAMVAIFSPTGSVPWAAGLAAGAVLVMWFRIGRGAGAAPASSGRIADGG